MLRVISSAGKENVAKVYIAEASGGRHIEFVESTPPPFYDRRKKWVVIVSSIFGCPIGCRFCDAGGYYQGNLSMEEILAQIEYPVDNYYPDRNVEAEKFKVQFARVGEPSLNAAVLDAIEVLHERFRAPGLVLSLSTIAPAGREDFFDRLLEIKKRFYRERFQLQFSIHTTSLRLRDWLIPARKMSFEWIADYGESFFDPGGKKITLNFAVSDVVEIDRDVLTGYFDPGCFLIKITPVNPTYSARKYGLIGGDGKVELGDVVDYLSGAGYEVILSIGELEENKIGSNCGQYVLRHLAEGRMVKDAYLYDYT